MKIFIKDDSSLSVETIVFFSSEKCFNVGFMSKWWRYPFYVFSSHQIWYVRNIEDM